MEKIITKTIDGLTVTVTITKSVNNKKAFSDGWNVDLGKETYENTTITIDKGGVKASCRDLNFFTVLDASSSVKKQHPQTHARFGDTYISEKIYNDICSVIAEVESLLVDDQEFIEVKAAENHKKEEQKKEDIKIEKEIKARDSHPGWCNKCGSYCYGDCES